MGTKKLIYLFSIDLEDVNLSAVDSYIARDRTVKMVSKILDYLDQKQMKTTFFIVGQTARKYPDLIKDISLKGHEIACHSDKHIELDKMNMQEFKKDLDRNLESLVKFSKNPIRGYRAPAASLSRKTSWVYSILKQYGFTYSSSVIPARNPLHGWREFGKDFKKVDEIWELPITLINFPFFQVPVSSGIYFRLIPKFIQTLYWRHAKKNEKIGLGYIHPYDVDEEEEYHVFPRFQHLPFVSHLMYLNRYTIFKKLDVIFNLGYETMPYANFVEHHLDTTTKL